MAGLESKISELDKIVEEMSNTFLGFSKDLLKSQQLDPILLKHTTQVFLSLSQRASHALDDEESVETGEDASHDLRRNESSSTELDMQSGFAASLGDIGDPPAQSFNEKPQPNLIAVVPGTRRVQPCGIPDPYQNYLWGTPQGSSNDGTSAIPYILAGRDSFASRLYFESIVQIVRALQGEAPSFLDSAYRFKRHYVSFHRILGVTSGVLNMLLHGTSQDPKERNKSVLASEPEDGDLITASIAQDLALRGVSYTEYLNTWNVELYLRDKWGLGVTSSTVRTPKRVLEVHPGVLTEQMPSVSNPDPIAFAPTLVPGFSHSEQTLFDAESLVEKIVLGAVSLGKGPRWHVSVIDGIVNSFLQESRIKL